MTLLGGCLLQKLFTVYILSSITKRLYTGNTSNFEQRIHQHRTKAFPGFTARYNIDRLVYFEQVEDWNSAATRERQIKGWSREKRVALIESMNPEWEDLSRTLFGI